jgi:putative salt-induced outer membrane protein YdiY
VLTRLVPLYFIALLAWVNAACSCGQELVEVEEPASPDRWFHIAPPQLVTWDGSVELGINGTTGNADTFSMRAGADLKRETDFALWEVKFTYAKTEADSVQTQHNALFRAKFEKLATDSPWTLFTRLGLEYDEFRDFDLRLTLNGGLGYRLIDTDMTKLKPRLGAGIARKFGAADDDIVPEATLGLDFEHKIGDRHRLRATVDYFPSFESLSDYRVVSDTGWEILLHQATNMSLKFSVIDRYDSTPEGAKANDLDYAVLLLWNL